MNEMIEHWKELAGAGEASLNELSNMQHRDRFALRNNAVGE